MALSRQPERAAHSSCRAFGQRWQIYHAQADHYATCGRPRGPPDGHAISLLGRLIPRRCHFHLRFRSLGNQCLLLLAASCTPFDIVPQRGLVRRRNYGFHRGNDIRDRECVVDVRSRQRESSGLFWVGTGESVGRRWEEGGKGEG